MEDFKWTRNGHLYQGSVLRLERWPRILSVFQALSDFAICSPLQVIKLVQSEIGELNIRLASDKDWPHVRKGVHMFGMDIWF